MYELQGHAYSAVGSCTETPSCRVQSEQAGRPKELNAGKQIRQSGARDPKICDSVRSNSEAVKKPSIGGHFI